MKKILLDFYSCRNLGDDLFVKIFSDYFRDCRINLIVNLRYIPKDLGTNVKIHPFLHSAEPSGLRCVSERTLCGA